MTFTYLLENKGGGMKVKRPEETLGNDGYVHYFVCGSDFICI